MNSLLTSVLSLQLKASYTYIRELVDKALFPKYSSVRAINTNERLFLLKKMISESPTVENLEHGRLVSASRSETNGVL